MAVHAQCWICPRCFDDHGDRAGACPLDAVERRAAVRAWLAAADVADEEAWRIAIEVRTARSAATHPHPRARVEALTAVAAKLRALGTEPAP